MDPKVFGIAVVTADGKVYTAGDLTTEVSIQSISKVYTMALVMNQQSPDVILNTIGADATGIALQFDHLGRVFLQGARRIEARERRGNERARQSGRHHRHQHGAGQDSYDEIWGNILDFYNAAAGRQLTVLEDVYQSEAATNQRNQAIGMLMYAYGYIKDNPLQAVDIYTRQCSVGVNARDLAMMAATLAFGGVNPVTKKQVMKTADVPEVLAVMATAGLYDDAGKWLFRTGLPAKSGVGGGIIAVSPGKFGIAVISPPVDAAGNSVRAQLAIADISNALGGNPYAQFGPVEVARPLGVGGGAQAPSPRGPGSATQDFPAGRRPAWHSSGSVACACSLFPGGLAALWLLPSRAAAQDISGRQPRRHGHQDHRRRHGRHAEADGEYHRRRVHPRQGVPALHLAQGQPEHQRVRPVPVDRPDARRPDLHRPPRPRRARSPP